MNSLTWLLAPRRTQSQSTSQPNHNAIEQPKSSSNGTVALLDPSSPLSSAALRLGTGPRETEAELVDNMVHSIERISGSIAANTLERKTSMGLDGELRFGLPGITERRRQIRLDSSSTNLSRSSNDPIDRINQSNLATPLPSPQSTPRPPIKLFSSYSPSYHLIRLLPVRMCVKLFILIRKFLALFGLRLPLPDPPPPDKSTQEQPSPTRFFRWVRFKFTSKQNSSLKTKELSTKNKTLVLDLDETLIHSTSRLGGIGGGKTWSNQSNSSAGLKARVVEVVLDDRIVVYHVYKRPWVDFFLKTVSSWYTVVIFTASMREYADPVIDWLDQGRGLIEGRLFRESCTNIQGSYVKDLTVVERDLSKVCLVDNSPISYGLHQANGIPIEGWLNDPKDEGLLELLPMLDSLRFTEDVRRILGLKGFTIKAKKI